MLRKILSIFPFILFSSIITFEISKLTNSMLAAGIVGFICSLIFPEYAIFSYIGAFIGMSSEVILHSLPVAVIASFFSTLLWILKQKLPELGGKAGFVAFLGVMLANVPRIFEIEIYMPIDVKIYHLIIAFLVSIVSVFFTLYIREIFRKLESNAVFASSVIGIVFGLLSLFIFFEPFPQVAFASSFAAMSSLKLVGNKFKYSIKTGILTAVIFFLFIHFFPGFGGKLGTIAFFATSTLLIIGM